MAEATIPVDLFNPGQVFACLGLLELSELLVGNATGGFEWDDQEVSFSVTVSGEIDPIEESLRFLSEASVSSVAPAERYAEKPLTTEKWNVPTHERVTDNGPFETAFEIPAPTSPATLPLLLKRGDVQLVVSSWGDGTRRDNMKFWAGAGGYPGVALFRDSVAAAGAVSEATVRDPFNVGVPQSSSFRLDWRRDYLAVEIGFSLNNHGTMDPVGFPWVELLALIGLSHARPQREIKLRYHYGVVRGAVRPSIMRVALGDPRPLPFEHRSFQMDLGWPGQEGQARCIVNVTELENET